MSLPINLLNPKKNKKPPAAVTIKIAVLPERDPSAVPPQQDPARVRHRRRIVSRRSGRTKSYTPNDD